MENAQEYSAQIEQGEVVEFLHHPEGSLEAVERDNLDVGDFTNFGLQYEHFDEFEDDVMASSVGGSSSVTDDKKWLVEVKKKEVDLLDKDDLKAFVNSTKNPNTVRKTTQIITAFQKWLSEYCMERPVDTIEGEELDAFMCNYFLNKKNSKGVEYQPDTLTGIHRGILRYLKDKDYPLDPLHDKEFAMSRAVLASKRATLKKAGLGNKPNRAEAFDEGQIQQTWDTGALGKDTPEALQSTVYFFLNIGFGLRGSHEARQMCLGDIELLVDEEGTEYIEFNERLSKTRSGKEGGHVRSFAPKVYATGDEKCPVKYFKLFLSKRPQAAMAPESPFYLNYRAGATMQDDVVFINGPMGINKIGQIVKKLSEKGGLAGRHTNHSLRKTTCQSLMAADVPPVLVAQLSGHKSLSSLNNYTQATRPQQKAMSTILTGGKRSASAGMVLPAPQRKSIKFVGDDTAIEAPPCPGPLAQIPSSSLGQAGSSSVFHELAKSASGMFSGAAVKGDIHVNINYNIQSSSKSSVNVSPVIPVKEIE